MDHAPQRRKISVSINSIAILLVLHNLHFQHTCFRQERQSRIAMLPERRELYHAYRHPVNFHSAHKLRNILRKREPAPARVRTEARGRNTRTRARAGARTRTRNRDMCTIPKAGRSERACEINEQASGQVCGHTRRRDTRSGGPGTNN